MTVNDPAPAHDDPIFHLAVPDDWAAAFTTGDYRMSTRGVTLEQEGFIHCSFAHQLEPVANTWYRDLDQLVILRLDLEALASEVRVEPSSDGSGELFPHAYGPIPVAAVAEAMVWDREAGQDWTLPDERADR